MDLNLPLLPLRDIVVFPGMIVPLFVGRDKSVVALEQAMKANKEIFLVAQLDPAEDDPGKDDLYNIGVTATIMQLLKLPDGTVVLEPMWYAARSILWLLNVRKQLQDDSSFLNARGPH